MNRLGNFNLDHRTGLYSLALAGAVALVAWFAWWIWQDDSTPLAVQRPLEQMTVTWKCNYGDTYQAPGAPGPQPCAVCGEEAYIVNQYHCSEHGELDVQLRYLNAGSNESRRAEVRFAGGDWTPYTLGLRCPDCGRPVTPAPASIFARGAEKKGEPSAD